MKIRSPSLVELHAFLAVSRLRSFRLAAEELCVTQAAVSRAVQRLEQHLGDCQLFERSSQGVALTEEGRQLRKLTERHVLALEAAATRLQGPRADGKLRLSVIPTLGTQWLLPRLARFREAHPDVDVEMRQFRHDEDFSRDDIDVWIEVKRPKRRWPARMQVKYLLGRELVPVCAPSLLSRLKRPGDLLQEALLHHTNFPENWALWAKAAGLGVAPKLGPGYDLSINLIFAAKAGLGIALTQPCLIERELEAGELVMPFDLRVDTGRGYFTCVDAQRPRSAAQNAFLDWILAEARQSEPTGAFVSGQQG
ncbi:LysR substrate-binding domain-containing protein [Cupriavidus metallidurans]|uniref:LysR substrate-binding domain-containing protein n=1 Tax=Cupriavidus TaxID=106589 RepID=UPI0002DBA199|nr:MULTISPECIES: LysR substrate-binding domain-containing protein [Cupriavidus]GMG94442.1 LysR family transcriptional regulator [Cupriavidus sp. TKC]